MTPVSWILPSRTAYEVERGETGISVWAVQRALNSAGFNLVLDGRFGNKTELAVKQFQSSAGLPEIGIFGQKTSGAMAETLAAGVGEGILPYGLLKGIVEGESSSLIASVNWSVPGGVDCSYVQRRVYSPYDDAAIQRAFDGKYQMNLLKNTLKGRHDAFFGQPGATSHQKAWRLATLNHNYPYGAAKIAEVGIGGLSSYWTTPQEWVISISGEDEDGNPISAYFPDGKRIETPLEWCRHYSLGDPTHDEPGKMCKYVVRWTP
jgi:hypothetical protein